LNVVVFVSGALLNRGLKQADRVIFKFVPFHQWHLLRLRLFWLLFLVRRLSGLDSWLLKLFRYNVHLLLQFDSHVFSFGYELNIESVEVHLHPLAGLSAPYVIVDLCKHRR
jgi:hypothetical protein